MKINKMFNCKTCGKRFTAETKDFVFTKDKRDYSVHCPYCGNEVHNSKFARY